MAKVALGLGPSGAFNGGAADLERSEGGGDRVVFHEGRSRRPDMRRGPGGRAESEMKTAVQRQFHFQILAKRHASGQR